MMNSFPLENPNQRKSAVAKLNELDKTPLMLDFKGILEQFGNRYETVSEAIAEPFRNKKKNKKKNKNTEKEEEEEMGVASTLKRSLFTPPTLEEVTTYCQARKSDVDPKRFLDYFTESDWVDSKGNKVKNWKQKVITWEGNLNSRKPDKNAIPDYKNDAEDFMGFCDRSDREEVEQKCNP